MGQTESIGKGIPSGSISDELMTELCNHTSFTPKEIMELLLIYRKIAGTESEGGDGLIDEDEFISNLNIKNEKIGHLMYVMLDKDGDHHVDFEEFVYGLNIFLPESPIDEKIDLCLMYKIKQVLNQYNKHFENYDYNKALEVVENFFWNDFCDNYLEIVKVRCYGINGIKYKDSTLTEEEKNKINLGQISAINTIYYVFNYLLKMFAPFVPCVCEEIYSYLYEEEFIEKLLELNQKVAMDL